MSQVITNLFQGLLGKEPVDYTLCDLLKVVQNFIGFMFQLAMVLGVLYIVYGGFLIMTAGGSEDRVKSGRAAITAAVVGVAIAMSSWMLVNVVLNVLGGGSVLPWQRLVCP